MKIVSPQEMARLEKIAYSQGAKEIDFMETAGLGIAKQVSLLVAKELPIILLCGKGNNAGDTYVAGRHLLSMGYNVTCIPLFALEECSPLCKIQAEKFLGKTITEYPRHGIILDGILGTGFRGNVEGVILEAIQKANASKLPIIAVDIPSGLGGSVAIQASVTVFLGLPKQSFFEGDGWNHVGKLIGVSFGIDENILEQAHYTHEMLTEKEIARLLPPIVRTRHKYQAGYVLGIAGSAEMPGAAILSSTAALRGGAGIVRLWTTATSLNLPPEIIPSFDGDFNRVSAVFIGPGMGKNAQAQQLLDHLIVPCVIDADALTLVTKFPPNSILTPHAGEYARLAGDLPPQEFVNKHNIILVLKGAPTTIFSPNHEPYINPKGDPGMATAGSGDVLTGLIASLLAQKLTPLHAALLGVFLHGLAGEIAAKEKTSYCLNASDLITAFPLAFKTLLSY